MKSLRCQRVTPDDVVSCLSVLVPYLAQALDSGSGPRIAIGQTPAMKYARRLVFVRITKNETRDMWMISPHWRERLILVGIDPSTFTVTDSNRWALAWDQLVTTKTFRISQQRVALNRGRIAPPMQPIERHWIQSVRTPGHTKPRALTERDNNVDPPTDENPYTSVLRRNIRRTITRGGIY